MDLGYFGDNNDPYADEPFDDFVANKCATIFLIDATRTMFLPYAGSNSIVNSPFSDALKCVCQSMRHTVMASESDQIGVVFFGTEKSQNALGDEGAHLFVFQPLEAPSRDRIKALIALEGELNLRQLKDDLGHSNAFSFSNALWLCQDIFAKAKTKNLMKQLFVLTINDEPHPQSDQLTRQALERATQLYSVGIEIIPIPLRPNQSGSFSGQKFYAHIERHAFDNNFSVDYDDARFTENAETRLAEISRRILVKEHRKRPLAHLPFTLGAPSATLAVKMYSLVRKMSKPPVVMTSKSSAQAVKTVTTLYRETGGPSAAATSTAGDGEEGEQEEQPSEFVQVMPQDVVKYQEFGGKRAYFEQHEVAELKNFGPPGISLIGFKPLSSLKIHQRFNHPGYFIYPDDDSIQGSTRLFSALLDRCLFRDVYILCRFIARKRTPPRLVALVPMAEKLDEKGEQAVPPGFNVAFLPFADEIRKIPALTENVTKVKVDRQAIDAAKKVIEAMTEDFKPRYNPALQKHWSIVEACALEYQIPEKFFDDSLPREELLKKAKDAVEEFNRILPPDTDRPGKRVSSSASGGGEVNLKDDVESAFRNGRLNALNVATLKSYIQTVLNVSSASNMRKQQLVEFVENHLRKSQNRPAAPKRLKVEEND